jgi:prevent-host-death family protein
MESLAHRRRQAVTSISLSDAQSRLSEIVRRLLPGEEVIITDNNQPVARLVASDEATRLAAAQIPNDRLLEIAERNKPPAWWYDGDEEDLF